jgi:outer membrane protein assembly factor BamB
MPLMNTSLPEPTRALRTRHGLLLAFILLQSPLAPAADSIHWRGSQRNDISRESSGWTGSRWVDPKPVWTRDVGEGCGSPLVVGNRLYTLGWDSDKDTLRCLDARNGSVLWQQSYRSPRYGRHALGDQSIYSGPSATPEFDPRTGRLYTMSTDGDLRCWDTKSDGQPVWHINLYNQYAAARRPEVAKRRKTRRDYGYTTSPLLWGDSLLVEVGGTGGNLIGFDPSDGHRKWVSQNRDEAGHSGGPVPMTVDGVACAVVLTLRNVVVTQISGPRAGRTVATIPWTTDFANNIPTPAVHGQSLVVTSAYNHLEVARYDVTIGSARQIWKQPFASGVCSPIIHKNRVYWAWQGVHCLDFETGERLWHGGRVGRQGSCILTSDDRLIIWANRGDLILADTFTRSPKAYREVSRVPGLSRADAWPHVVLSGRRIFVKDRYGKLLCLAIPD